MSKEAMTLALESLRKAQRQFHYYNIAPHLAYQDAIKALEEALAKQEQGEPDWKALVLNHNADCESRCNMDSCGYKPYFEYSKRRCPNCPVHEMIDVEYTTPQPAQKPWVGLTDDERRLIEIKHGLLYFEAVFFDIEAKLKEKNT